MKCGNKSCQQLLKRVHIWVQTNEYTFEIMIEEISRFRQRRCERRAILTNSDIKYDVNKQRARFWARSQSTQLLWICASDVANNKAIQGRTPYGMVTFGNRHADRVIGQH